MRHWPLTILLAMGLSGLSANAVADRLIMDDLDPDRVDRSLPRNGETMQQVEARFGAPKERIPAVGDPPISRWDYSDYIVYFEHQHVLHSVRKR